MDRLAAAALEAAPCLMAVTDAEGRVVLFNRACEDLTGLRREEVRGKKVEGLFPAASGSRDVRWRARDGGERVLEWRAAPVREDGLSFTLWTGNDVTEKCREDEARTARLELLPQVVDGITDAVFVKDLEGRYVLVNPAGARMLGRPVEEVIGRDDTQLFEPDLARVIVEDDRRILASGQGETFQREGTPRGGEWQVWLVSKGLLRDGRGRVTGVMGTCRDVTGQRQSEQSLRQSEGRLRIILEQMPTVLWTTDRDLRVTCSMGAGLARLGLTPDQLLGVSLVDFLREDGPDAPGIPAHLRALEGIPQTYETDWRGRFFQVHIEPLRDAAGQIAGCIGVVLDITDRRQAEDRLRDYSARLQSLSRQLMAVQEAERHRLARELHDEVGQALTAIRNTLEAALRRSGDGASSAFEDGLSAIDETIGKVRNLSLDLRPSILDDLGLTAALRWHVDRQAQRAGLEAQFVSPPRGGRLGTALETACFRVAQEAMTNVVRHARARRLWVTLEQEEREVRLTVRDDGVGFDVEEARRRAARGGSFGLLGMQERVLLLGGKMEVESAPSRGTTVRVRFPTGADVPPP